LLTEVTAAATEACSTFQAFPLTVGPLAGSRGAIRFTVTPWTRLDAVHERLHTATARALDNPGLGGRDRFRPHVSIAYGNQTRSAEPVVETVAQLRDIPPAVVYVRRLHLVCLRRENRTYKWDVVATLPPVSDVVSAD